MLLLTATFSFTQDVKQASENFKFGVSFTPEIHVGAIDGRLLLLISDDDSDEPRFQISSQPNTQMIFGTDIDKLNPDDTKYIKHVKMQSKLLTEFWGRPMYLGACVLLPRGFESRSKISISH